MKKIIIIGLLLTVSVVSCSLTKQNKEYRSTINGSWVLSKTYYNNTDGVFSSILFQDKSIECFKNSIWTFVANNSRGTYTLSRPECSPGVRYIRWSVYEGGATPELQFKFTNEKGKDISGSGFHLKIEYLDQSNMRLRSDATVDGKPIGIIYEFKKNI